MTHVTEASNKDEDLVYHPAFTLPPENPGPGLDPHPALQDCAAAILKTSDSPYCLKTHCCRQPSHPADENQFSIPHCTWILGRYLILCYKWTCFLLPQSSAPPLGASSDEEIGCVTLTTHLISSLTSGMHKYEAEVQILSS